LSRSFAEIARHPARFGVLATIAIAVAMLALFLARMDTGAVHNEGMLEMDGNVAYDGGDGFDPGTNNCPFSVAGPDSGNPDDCILDNSAAFDWADTCDRTSSGALAGYITEASSQPSVLTGSDVICNPDFIIGATDDTSYHTGSDKDFQEMGGGGTARWHCTTSANATSKADILNAYAIVTSVDESTPDHQLVYIGAERDSENGSVFNGYWILQGDISVPGATTTAGQLDCTPSAPLDFSGLHQCGDVLVRFNYTSGGRIGAVRANEWVAPSPDFVGTFIAANGCDQIAGNADDCTAAQQASAETHTVPGGFLCDRPPAQGDCRSAADQTAPGDDLCGRVNGATDCTIRASHNEPFPPPCSGPGSFPTDWEPNDGSPASKLVQSPTFSEMGIDLTGLNLELPCIATLIVESRSSPAIDATLKDIALAPTGEDCASSIRTEIHSELDNSDDDLQGTTVDAGTMVHDVAFLTPTGPGSADPATGTITFTLFNNDSCDPGEGDVNVISTEPVTITDQIPGGIPVNTEGSVDSSELDTSTTTTTAISYNATADLDDPYSDPGTSDCEPLNIIYSPTIVTNPDPDEGHVGDTLNDTATLSGGFEPTGTILFELFPPADTTCAGTPVFSESVTVSGNGDYSTTTGYTVPLAGPSGTYHWTASYSGDANNNAASSSCADEPVVIINPSTILTKTAVPSVVTTVTYTYTEENDGDVPLTNPTVSDPECEAHGGTVAYDSGDGGVIGTLDAGETWTFTCTATYTGEGTFTNTATGSGVDPQNFTVTYCVTPPNGTTICDAEERDSRTVTVDVTVS